MVLTYQTSWDSMPAFSDPHSELANALFGFISDPFDSNARADINSLFTAEPKSQFYSEPKSLYFNPEPKYQFNPEPKSQFFIAEPKSQFCSEPEPETALPIDSYLSFISPPPHYRYIANDDFTPNPSKRYKIHNDVFNTNTFFDANQFGNPNPSPRLSPSLSPKSYSSVALGTNFEYNKTPNSFGIGTEGQNWSKSASVPVSATSMAARERRKRISDKTLELGKLVPGGSRMNTAEMFQTAYDYIKFMRAQSGILTLINKNEGGAISLVETERMQLLLGSTNLHEKFSAEGKCLVPKKIVNKLAKDNAVRSNVFVARDLDRFVESIQTRD